MGVEELINEALNGDKRAIARLISIAEDYPEHATSLVRELKEYVKECPVIGITGPQGVGKSTLIGKIVKTLKGDYRDIERIAILCIDPSSIITGGAFLGDRIRMADYIDEKVFVRSMATRGSLIGGICRAAYAALYIYKATYRPDLILVETTGTGQADVGILAFTDKTLLVLTPAAGDEIQVLKAGCIELADAIVVNKADLPGSDIAVSILSEWFPNKPIFKTNVISGEGIKEVVEYILSPEKVSEEERLRKYRIGIKLFAADKFMNGLEKYLDECNLEDYIKEGIDLLSASEQILSNFIKKMYQEG